MERLAAKPTADVPQACRGWDETMGAYRFFDNDEVEWRAILEPHWRQTEQRMAAQSVVLCLQDTTELDFNGRQAIGLGPLSYEAQRGMYLHPTYAVTPERVPLGVLDAWMWAREPKDGRASAAASRKACAGSRATSGWRKRQRACRTRDWCTSLIARRTCSH